MGKNKNRKQKKLGRQATVAPAKIKIQANDWNTGIAAKSIIPGPWQTNAITFLLLVVATLVLYAGDLRLGFFAVDDPQYVVDNRWIRGVTFENLRHILITPYFANYSPLHLFSYLFDYVLAGPSAFAFHLSSNLWGGLVAGFVFLAALTLTGSRVVAVAAAALFIVHPAHVEAIAWVSSRKDLVAAAFALPSLLAYLRYRRGGPTARPWYVASVLLFLFAVAGKLSVATLPAVLLAYDLFIERRPLSRSLWDKVPFVLGAGVIALVVALAQPSMGNRPNAYVSSAALLQNFWLLTGFGQYVIYRVPPKASVGIGLEFVSVLFLLTVFAAPLLLARRWPLVTVLIYWILLALIPAQVLSFSHPVTDRYLFFPSVAAVILIAWGLISAGKWLGHRGLIAAVVILVSIGVLWGGATLAYVAEWRDPRSVWYAATSKSSDPKVSENLGSYYLGMADRFGAKPQPSRLADEEARGVASVVWAGDPRLPNLLSEWSAGQHDGPLEKALQDHLRTLGWNAFEQSLSLKGTHVMPGLRYNRGLILASRGELEAARKEFLAALEEASRETFAPVQQQITVYSHTQLGAIAARKRDYNEALRWYRLAEEEQSRFGAKWVPGLAGNIKQLEAIIASPQTR
jgi:protein O-mannosyl-transferase